MLMGLWKVQNEYKNTGRALILAKSHYYSGQVGIDTLSDWPVMANKEAMGV